MTDTILRALQEQIAALQQRMEELERNAALKYATQNYVRTYVEQMLGDIMPIQDQYTENTPIIGYVPLDIERTLKHFKNIKSTYTLYDYGRILLSYDEAADNGGINPYIAIAQMAKETDWCRSWWSQRPRRNPAGIGVTGEKSIRTQEKTLWAFDELENLWKKGYSFPSWEIAAQAHIGHLLAYAYTDQQLTEHQQYLVATDPRARFIPKDKRGTVRLLKQLDGNWAVPGIGYGKSIAILANALRT